MSARLFLPKLELGEVAIPMPDGREVISETDAVIYAVGSDDLEITVKGPDAFKIARSIVNIRKAHAGIQKAADLAEQRCIKLTVAMVTIQRVAEHRLDGALSEISALTIEALMT